MKIKIFQGLLLYLIALAIVPPDQVQSWTYAEGEIHYAPLPDSAIPVTPSSMTDFDLDGVTEELEVVSGQAVIVRQDTTVWHSPAAWEVTQAILADLNRDSILEAVLLVWRPYQPWPIDRYLPHAGRIQNHQNAQGQSCQLILIGWKRGAYRELWAGSGLARPLTSIAAGDLQGDGFQELIALEGEYIESNQPASRALTIWEWNGFGFNLLTRLPGQFRTIQVFETIDDRSLILTRE